MVSSLKRNQPMDEGNWPSMENKKGKFVAEESSVPLPPRFFPRVILNPADCDLDFNIEEDGLVGSAFFCDEFAYCWSGARANLGIERGKYCFGLKIITNQPVNMNDTPWYLQNLCQIGISLGEDPLINLGETHSSICFASNGKISSGGSFMDYGETFMAGDTVACCVDLDSEPASVGFCKNGKWLGIAMQFDAGPGGLGVVGCPLRTPVFKSALFPHILLKNVVVEMQFTPQDGLVPFGDYQPWASSLNDGMGILGPDFQSVSDCEVIMMVGLPACGKSTWAENWVKIHPEKRYVLIGTKSAMDKMKVPSLGGRKGEQLQRWMTTATQIMNTLFSRASKIPRNIIFDQSNNQKNPRKRKLKPFADYRKFAVVVFPQPEELRRRAEKCLQEEGKEVRAEAVNDLLANFSLPMSKDMPFTDEYFDEVFFPELGRSESEGYIDQMKRDGTLHRVYHNARRVALRSFEPPPQNYQSSFHQTSPVPSFRAPPQNQASLPAGNLGLGGHQLNVDSYNPQVLFANQPQGQPPQQLNSMQSPFGPNTTAEPYGFPYGTQIPRPPFGNFPPR